MKSMSSVIPGIVAAASSYLWSVDLPAQDGSAQQVLPDGIRGGSEFVPGPGVEIRTYRFEETGEDLPYSVYVSSKVERGESAPLIVALRGFTGTTLTFVRGTAVDLAEEGGYILVGPIGYNNRGGFGMPPRPRPAASTDAARAAEPPLVGGSAETDTAVVSRYGEQDVMNVLARVREEFAIDDDRIYLMGHSQGGGGALHLAEKYPSIWAGVALLAPALFDVEPAVDSNILDIPLMIAVGDDDFLLEGVRRYSEKLSPLHSDYEYREIAGLDHGTIIMGSMPGVFRFFGRHSRDGTRHAVEIAADGSVHVPAHVVPMSSFLSPAGRDYVTQHLHDVRRPELLVQEDGIPALLVGYLQRQREAFPVERNEITVGGVHAFEYIPRDGIARGNEHRVLINLHGGGFSGCWPACAELESIPVAGLGGIRVISLDYRQGPEHRFPAASEDVAAAYRALLETYRPGNIGIYGCSAGGMLTGMAVAWFHEHGLPMPGAVGVLCAGLTPPGNDFDGDASYTTLAIGEGRMPSLPPSNGNRPSRVTGSYLDGVSLDDPLVAPANSPDVLAAFPPTLVVTGTRSFDMSAAVHAHSLLVKAGVDADLHVWEGMFHGFFYNPDVPESIDCYTVIVNFFDKHLA